MRVTENVTGWINRLRHLESSVIATDAKAENAKAKIAELLKLGTPSAKAEIVALQSALDAPAALRASIAELRKDLKGAAELISRL